MQLQKSFFLSWKLFRGRVWPDERESGELALFQFQKIESTNPVCTWETPKSTVVAAGVALSLQYLKVVFCASAELWSIIPDWTCATLICAVLYNSNVSPQRGAVKETHANDRRLVIHHCRHLDTRGGNGSPAKGVSLPVRSHFVFARNRLAAELNVTYSKSSHAHKTHVIIH